MTSFFFRIFIGFAVGAISLTGPSPLTANAAAQTSLDRSAMMVGDWVQGADLTMPSGDGSVRFYDIEESYRADGTTKSEMNIEIKGDGIPADLKDYVIVIEGTWALKSDELHIDPISTNVTYQGENPIGLNIAAALEKDMGNSGAPMIVVSINTNNIVLRAEDGSLISLQRK